MTTKSSRASKQVLFSTRKQRKTTYENHSILTYSTYNRVSSSVTMMFSLNWETKHFCACSRSEFASSAWERRDENKKFELSQTFLFINSLTLIAFRLERYRFSVDAETTSFRARARNSLTLSNIRFLKSHTTIYSRKIVTVYTTRANSRTKSWSEIDKATTERRLQDESMCILTRLLEESLVKISRTQAWLIRKAKERVALIRRRRFDISCKTWSICLKEISADNEKSKSRDCVRDEDESWCAMTAIDSNTVCVARENERACRYVIQENLSHSHWESDTRCVDDENTSRRRHVEWKQCRSKYVLWTCLRCKLTNHRMLEIWFLRAWKRWGNQKNVLIREKPTR
jgi:hypothetical protein